MKILLAPDSFKGSASSRELCEWMEKALRALAEAIGRCAE